MPFHYQSLPYEMACVYLAEFPKGHLASGEVFWQMFNSVIIISLNIAHQRGITSESI